MNKHRLTIKSLHHSAKSVEVLGGWNFEIYWDMHIGHVKICDKASLLFLQSAAPQLLYGWQDTLSIR